HALHPADAPRPPAERALSAAPRTSRFRRPTFMFFSCSRTRSRHGFPSKDGIRDSRALGAPLRVRNLAAPQAVGGVGTGRSRTGWPPRLPGPWTFTQDAVSTKKGGHMRYSGCTPIIVVAVLVVAGLALAGAAEAIVIEGGSIGFVPREQFVRVNVASFEDPDYRPNPCTVAVTVFDVEGGVLKATRLAVGNGQTRSVDLTLADLPHDTAPGRLQVRVMVQFGNPEERKRCAATL